MIRDLPVHAALRDSESWGVFLIWSCLLLLPFGRMVEVSVLLMALLGVVIMVSNRQMWVGDRRVKLFCGVFAASWIPMLLSLPDAVNMGKTGEVVINHLRFLFSGLFIVHVLKTPRAWRLLTHLLGLTIAFWVIDALVQYWAGTDLFGIEAYPGRLSAMFGPGNTKFGITLAVFLPVLWEYTRRYMGSLAAVVIVIVTVAVVVLSAQRSAWILVAAAALIYAVCLTVWMRILPLRSMAGLAIAAVIVVAASYFVSDKVRSGVDRGLAAFSSDVYSLNNSIVHRFWIWKGGWAMYLDNPINGVGARGFRYAFESYAKPDDPFFSQDPPIVPLHSHQVLIDIGTETGSLGLAGLILMVVLLVRAALRIPDPDHARLLPYIACVGAAYFPLNTHLAIYSAYWSQIVWYLIALYCAAVLDSKVSTADIKALETRPAEK